jgi:hypothetical protein
MVKEYVILGIILVGLFSGCIGEESITGKYVYDKDPKLYFILYEDGTFNEWFEGGSSGSGTYRYEKNRLFLTNLPFGNVDVFTKNGTSFEYEGKGGGRYVKVKK